METKELKMEALHDVYKELAHLVGYENMEKLFEYYRGQQLNFPTRIYDQKYIRDVLREEFDGTNVKALARRLGYSERWIRRLIKEETGR